ncbi:MAG: FMN-binding protein [Patescibacteria group bacterium]|nr:FMN-binding protein [Patescibacteria group bacterium]MDE1988108.1 FMN-binding protein [Patescibacteria group bacterium]MDE2218433.1 FMN-binding protein [Patescibacteria group bacterium]
MPMMNKGQYKNGEYTGNIADAYYGNIQVKTIISGAKITDVQFLNYPNDRQNSIRINAYAMPILKSEAIKAQSAKVDVVSGATATSGAFQESLASALAQAKN